MNGKDRRPGYTTGMAVFEEYGDDVPTVMKPFGEALIRLAREREDVLGMSADLAKYTDIDIFGEAFPDRFFNLGMAEQNLYGVAAGLARVGFVPFATSYCSFAGRRAYDFIAIGIAEGRANVKVIAALPGLTTGYGATHQGIEDLALMRAVPNLVVIDPCDAVEIERAVPVVAAFEGPVYMRILRGRVKKVLPDDYRFAIGQAKWIREGSDVLLISSGVMTDRALQAAETLHSEGVGAGVLHVSTLKPLDADTIIEAASSTPRIVTMENHSVIGGLGSAVAEAICLAGLSVRLKVIGVPDVFMESGSVPFLTEKYGLGVSHAIEAVRELLS